MEYTSCRCAQHTSCALRFKPVELSDRDTLNKYIAASNNIGCETCFSNLYLWHRFDESHYAVKGERLYIRFEKKGEYGYFFPMHISGELSQGAAGISELVLLEGELPKLIKLTDAQRIAVEQLYPDAYSFVPRRGNFDYIHDAQSLRDYSGKKLHSKRNHLNRFLKTYEGRWSFEALDGSNVEDCREMSAKWSCVNHYYLDNSMSAELEITALMLDKFVPLGLLGGCLRVDGKVAGFTIASPSYPDSDTLIIHCEKAMYEYEGIYPALASLFLQAHPSFVKVNREDDLDDEGLRKSKLSYNPIWLLESFDAFPVK
ncbi:MAG: DUF2156 domain-containing protein [Eubacteriales bacterium]